MAIHIEDLNLVPTDSLEQRLPKPSGCSAGRAALTALDGAAS